VFLQQPGMELDLGAIAKGYIADRVRDPLTVREPISACASANGFFRPMAHSPRVCTLPPRRWHHILDPRSGYPLDNELDSVTVISTDSLDGDIWTPEVTTDCPLTVREPISACASANGFFRPMAHSPRARWITNSTASR
jgi:hypothetical protein